MDWQSRLHLPNVFSVVFPIERLVSGFLDKCVSGNGRERHCEPNEVFSKGSKQEAMFGAYVDTFLLK